jgi:hypothetical protein
MDILQAQIADPAIDLDNIAHIVTNSIMQAVDRELTRQGVEGGMGETGLKLRDALQTMVAANISEMRHPTALTK